jgi:hypothetical protein
MVRRAASVKCPAQERSELHSIANRIRHAAAMKEITSYITTGSTVRIIKIRVGFLISP